MKRKTLFVSQLFSMRRTYGLVAVFLLGGLPASTSILASEVEAKAVSAVSSVNQVKKIKGTVVDAQGEPIIGANVLVKGTTVGVITDIDGNFQLDASAKSTLVVTFIGYKDQSVTVGNQTQLRVVLQEDNALLDEVVVVGYGTKQKKSLTAAVETMNTEEMRTMPVVNASNAFAGRVPGLITVQNNGEIGADGTNIMIRGISTTGSTSPLIIVDGVPRGSLNQIDMNNVKSYTVLKDAAAVAPYGIGGANGVILIETKSGSAGKPVVNYNGWIGWSKATTDIEYCNAYEYANTFDVAQAMDGVPESGRRYSRNDLDMFRRAVEGDPTVDRNVYANTNAHDYLLRKSAPVTNHSINISGGTEYVKYYVGLNTMYQEEQWKNAFMNRTGVVSKIDINATKTTKFGLSLNGYTQYIKKKRGSGQDVYAKVQQWLPTDPLYLVDKDGNQYVTANSGGSVITDLYSKDTRKTYNNSIMLSAYLEQQLAKGLTLKGVFSYDWYVNNARNWGEPSSTYYKRVGSNEDYQIVEVPNEGNPSLYNDFNQTKTFTYQAILTYKGHYKDHNWGVLAVAEAKNSQYNGFWANRSNFNMPLDELDFGPSDYKYWGNGGNSSESAQVGFVGQLSYDYKSKYLIDLTGRYDGHYYFAPGHRWGFFPAASVAWRISEESFMQDFENLDNLKIRFSAGQSGALAGGAFQWQTSYQLRSDSFAPGGALNQGVGTTREGNPYITWEKATKYDVGVDFDLFHGMLSGKVDYFFEKRNNMLVNPGTTVPKEYGIALGQVNAGEMQNQGIEFELSGQKKIGKDWGVSAGFVFTFARNKIINIFENNATRNSPTRTRTGRPLGTLFGYRALGLFQESDDKNGDGFCDELDGFEKQQLGGRPKPGDIHYFDADGNGVIDGADETRIGYSTIPEIMYGFNLGATFKGFNLDLFFQGAAHSNAMISGTFINYFEERHNLTKDNLDYWTPENPNAHYPRLRQNGQLAHNNQNNSFFMMNMNYLRLKSIELGYSLPASLLNPNIIQNAKIYIAATNPFTLSHTRGLLDPEQDGGSTSGNGANRGWRQPQNKTISIGVNITF